MKKSKEIRKVLKALKEIRTKINTLEESDDFTYFNTLEESDDFIYDQSDNTIKLKSRTIDLTYFISYAVYDKIVVLHYKKPGDGFIDSINKKEEIRIKSKKDRNKFCTFLSYYLQEIKYAEVEMV